MSAIDNLRAAVEAAAGDTAFALDAAFLTMGLADPAVTVPADYDSWIVEAFFLKAAADFKAKAAKADVGAVSGKAFTVKNATIPFIGAAVPLSAKATLVFTVDGDTLVVQAEASPANWTWTNSFAFMNGFPFNQFPTLKGVSFVFSTKTGKYPFGDDKGRVVSGGAVQNFSATVPLPAIVQPFLSLFSGLTAPTGDLLLSGPLNMAAFNGESVLFPPGRLSAAIQNGSFDLTYLKVQDPSVTITIPAPDKAVEVNGVLLLADPLADPDAGDQAPTLAISSRFDVGNGGIYSLDVQITPGATTSYTIGLSVAEDGTPLTPAAIINLMGGNGGYLAATPDTVQQFLTFVGLNGFSISGELGASYKITALSVDIGSSKNTSWTILPDPTGALDFTITSFSLNWAMAYPFDPPARQTTYDFSTEFTLATSVFKGPGGVGNGVFGVKFNSQRQFYANFTGTAKLSDFLATLSGGAVVLDQASIGDFELGDIALAIDYGAQSFSFSAGFSLELNLLQVNGEPILAVRDGTVRVAAKSPTQSKTGANTTTYLQSTNPQALALAAQAGSGTQWQAGIDGFLKVGPLEANVRVAYDGFVSPKRWELGASLARPLPLSDLINQFFSPGSSYGFPSFIPGNLAITAFAIDAVIPAETGALKTSYNISTAFRWTFAFGDQTVGIDPAKLSLSYDGNKPTTPVNQQFSGSAQGTWIYTAINLRLTMGYEFKPTAQGANNILFVEWEGFRAEWQSGKELVTFSLKGWSIGTLIQALVRTLGNPYFTLDSPWNLLNQISLDALRVNVSLKNGETFSQRLSATYALSSPINLGFISITGLTFRRDVDGKVTLAIEGSSPLTNTDPAFKNLMDPAKGQDVQNLPPVPGRGEEWFKLFLLVLGQRIGITGYSEFKNTKDVICALQKVPSTTGKTNPVDPNANQGSTKGLPYYNQSNNWMIAGHLGLMKIGNTWSIDAMLVFNDPNLYGLRLALAGEKMGGLANLVIDIMYKKITDDIGVYQIEFTFPDIIRNLNFGAVSITLPQLGIKVYTNGDFFIDIGFPYNLDFRRSFSISVIVYGVPVLGSGGFYFGKLSNATSTKVPKTNLGTFDPVIEFGLGLQLGLGYNFEKGPLKAGFALTVFGIIEGVIAPWHPYDKSGTELMRASSGGALQSDYYFKVSGTVGIIGLLYGSIDFKIISASLNVKIVLSLQITYECYREIPVVATASVSVSLKVKIDLGLFSITISLSFSTSVTAKFILGSNQTAPWEVGGGGMREALAAPQQQFLQGPDAAAHRAQSLQPKPKRLAPATMLRMALADSAADVPTLTLMAGAQYTVLAPEGATDPAQNQGAFVFLLAMDAPDPAAGGAGTGNTSFDKLAQAYFPWIIDTMSTSHGDTVDLAETLAKSVTLAELEAYITRLADTAKPVLSITELLQFLADGFKLNIEDPATAKASGLKDKLDKGSMLFPVFDGLSVITPNAQPVEGPATGDPSTIDFETYATATPAYAAAISALFAQVAAQIDAQNRHQPLRATLDQTAESMAALVFVDSFTLIARQLLQAGADALKSYAYPLQGGSSIQTILTELNGIAGNALTISDVALPNVNHALGAKLALTIDALLYVTQASDTLQSVATRYSDAGAPARWTTTPSQLIVANRTQHMLQGGVTLTLTNSAGNPQPVLTRRGDSFDDIARELGGITIEALAAQSVLYTTPGLLTPTLPMTIPPIAYTSAGTSGASTDTLASLAQLFQTSAAAIATANVGVAGLFSPTVAGGLLNVANLQALSVGALWNAVAATGQVGQTAGMVSRFLVYGLRLPSGSGLTLSSAFLYPTGQTAYGAYQLTGQQFPIPASATSYAITLSRAATSHGVNLNFITLDGAAAPMPVDLTAAYSALQTVVGWAKTPGNFAPAPSFAALPLAERQAKAFTVSSFARWSSGSVAHLKQLTNRSASVSAADDGAAAQAQPTLWALPPAQTNLVAAREQAIQAVIPGIRDTYKLLPQFQPQLGTTNPATSQTSFADLQNWAWCTRIDIEIKRLPDAQALAQQTGTNDLPSGPASAPSLPFIYELVGPNSADGVRLERILTAMNELGEDMASAVFLLYNQSGPGTPMLVTPADGDFLAFITQTNLSTETNPPMQRMLAMAEGAPPRGIANSPAQFIRLMWELSTVRSGGYYLYYEDIKSGAGLPPAVFDSSGSGTLTMVVTFATKGKASFGGTVPNFVTSFVTTDPVDQNNAVQTLSLASTGPTAPVTAQDSLETLSVIYGPGPGQIAEANGPTPLATNALIPIRGAVRQLTNADLVRSGGNIDPVATLNKLAALFSAGAVQVGGKDPISGQDIANYNPGVTVALGAVFYIPPVTYKVATNAAPGTTFNSMSAHYGLSIDLLARGAADAKGIFPAAPVQLNPEIFDLRDLLPPQNLGAALTRVNYGVPPDKPTDPNFARNTMYQLYTSLAAGLAANVFFKSSPLGMPFGPQDHGDDAPEAFHSHASAADARGARLNAVAEADLDYRQSIGVNSSFALVNAAPVPSDPNLPGKDGNPYLGVGTNAQIALQWRDIFGNTVVTPFEAPSPSYSGALNGSAVAMLYRDQLIGLGGWTNTNASYTYDSTGGNTLKLSFALNAAAYAGDTGKAQAQQDLRLYTRLYYQLHQDYSNVAVPVPGVTGNAVTMRVSNSLMAAAETQLTDAQADTIRGYVRACVLYLTAVAAGQPGTAAAATLALPVDVSKITTGNIIEMDVALTLARNPLLVEPSVAALQDGLRVSGAILPHADSDANVAYTAFSLEFEKIFQTGDWYLKVGEGLSRAGADAAGGAQQLWAVRFGKAKDKGIYFQLGTKPSYYSPKPVAKALSSGVVKITGYETGESVTLNLDGVDLNEWFQSTLDAIDQFLSATYAPHAFILDKLDGIDDPLKKGMLGQVLATKDQLANSISGTALPVLSTSADDVSTQAAAAEKLRQQLLNQLGAAYRGGAAVVFGLTDVSGGEGSNPAGPPNLYGQPMGVVQGAPNNQNFTLTPTRIPLGPVMQGQTVLDPRLAFVFISKNVDSQAYVPLTLDLQISHLEFERASVPGIEGYVESRWLAFVNGPFPYDLGNGVSNIPVVNRNLPTPPTVSSQTALQLTGRTPPADAATLNKWGYEFEYLYQQAASDAVSYTIEYNGSGDSSANGNGQTESVALFTALAQFITNYDAILRDLNTYLVKIDGEEPDQVTFDAAKKAVSAFATQTATIATAYAASLKPPVLKAQAELTRVIVKFLSTLDATPEGYARTNIVNVTINGAAATWDAGSNTISGGGITLPAPVIAIEPQTWTAQPVPVDKLPPGVTLAYLYSRQVDKNVEYLPEDKALGIGRRQVSMSPLNVLALQSGWASVFVQRNLALFPIGDLGTVRTNDAFLFQTPEVRFANPIVPRLVYDSFALDGMSGAAGDLDPLLTLFFQQLYTGGAGTAADVSMQGLYSYELVAGQPAIPRVRLPINLLTPSPSTVDPSIKPDFITPFATVVGDWRAANQPTTGGAARVEIELKVFGAIGDAKQPLIQVGQLTHDVST